MRRLDCRAGGTAARAPRHEQDPLARGRCRAFARRLPGGHHQPARRDGEAAAPSKAPADKLARVEMQADTSYLTDEERKVVNLLIQAADLMNPIYLRQVSADNPRHPRGDREERRQGAARPLRHVHGAVGRGRRGQALLRQRRAPGRRGLLSRRADQGAVRRLSDQASGRSQGADRPLHGGRSGRATSWSRCPISQEYKQWLEPAAQKLEQAAAITTNPSLKKFLTLRAKAFRTDDYFESELAWMDLKDTPIEMVIGPYETYTDTLYGAKTAFEAYVVLRNPKESAALDIYKSHLREMEANLPEDEQYKNFKRGFESPISVGDQIHAGGDSNHGIQTRRLQPAQRRARARGQGREEGDPAERARREIRPHPAADGEPGAGARRTPPT